MAVGRTRATYDRFMRPTLFVTRQPATGNRRSRDSRPSCAVRSSCSRKAMCGARTLPQPTFHRSRTPPSLAATGPVTSPGAATSVVSPVQIHLQVPTALLVICRPSGCTVAYGVVVVVVVVVVCNRSQMRTSKCTCLIFGVSICLDPG